MSSHAHNESLAGNLRELGGLLRKYGHDGQADVVERIVGSLGTPNPEYELLAGIAMWGGAGAVWDVCLSPFDKSDQARADEMTFRKMIIRIADAMEHLGIGTARSRDIAEIFQGWIDKGI